MCLDLYHYSYFLLSQFLILFFQLSLVMPMHTGTLSYFSVHNFLEPYRVDRWRELDKWKQTSCTQFLFHPKIMALFVEVASSI